MLMASAIAPEDHQGERHAVAERSPLAVRGRKTICIPCSQQEYGRVVDDPEWFRELLDLHIKATPELFPLGISRGYRMRDVYHSRKTGWDLRRIELCIGECYLVRPCFLMPYLSGRTADVPANAGLLLFSASSVQYQNSPSVNPSTLTISWL